MEWNFIDGGINAVVIDNFFNEQQLSRIWQELGTLTSPEYLKDETKLASAVSPSGEFQTSKSGVFLDEHYQEMKNSPLMSSVSEVMTSEEVMKRMLEENPLYKCLYTCNSRSHLLSYYQNGDYYKKHVDSFFFTVLCYFHKEPKQFEGGEVILHSMDGTQTATVEPRNNRVVIIASCTPHEVNEVKMDPADDLTGNGRYCFTVFSTYQDERMFKNDSN